VIILRCPVKVHYVKELDVNITQKQNDNKMMKLVKYYNSIVHVCILASYLSMHTSLSLIILER